MKNAGQWLQDRPRRYAVSPVAPPLPAADTLLAPPLLCSGGCFLCSAAAEGQELRHNRAGKLRHMADDCGVIGSGNRGIRRMTAVCLATAENRFLQERNFLLFVFQSVPSRQDSFLKGRDSFLIARKSVSRRGLQVHFISIFL